MKPFAINLLDRIPVGSHSQLLPFVVIVWVICSGTLNAQPTIIDSPRNNRVSSPSARSVSGDPFTKITAGEIVNDGFVNSTGSSWADYDNDGDLDLYSCNYGSNNLFYVNNGDGTFTRITAIHIIHSGNSNAGIWADYDNDGDLDLIVANDGLWYDMESWFRNNGDGTFEQIVTGPIANDGGAQQGVCWADYDNDGYLDLFMPNGFSTLESNFLYHNSGDGTFTRITTGELVTDPGTWHDAGWGDYDNDGDMDLFLTNVAGYNSLYNNNGDGTFTRDTTSIVAEEGGNSWGSCWGDYDNDGDLDLFVCNPSGLNNFFYRNNGNGTFEKDTTNIIANDGGDSRGASWADYDNDGDLDLFVTNAGGSNFFYENNGDGTFIKNTNSIISNEGGYSETCMWGDYDNDGDLDLFVSNEGVNNYLYRNNGNGNGWIDILCVGTASNRSGIGAKVKAKATINGNSKWQLREVEGQSGLRSQNSLNVEFGFGDATILDSLRVEWPSGTLDVLTNVGVNQFITVTEGQAIPAVGDGKNNLPHEFDLQQNYPNPFNPSTKIKYSVPNTSHVTLKVYNMLGQEVATLVNELQDAGEHEAEFSVAGQATGAYFYRLEAGKFKETKKFVLLK